MEPERELLIRLDERVKAEQQRVNYFLAAIDNRLTRLEQRPSLPQITQGTWGWFKIVLAACLTVSVWLATGDPKAAMKAAGAPFALQ